MKIVRKFNVVGGTDGNVPSQSVIDTLEEALDLARRGTLQEVVVTGMTADAVMINGWSEVKSVMRMLGSLYQTMTDYQVKEVSQRHPKSGD